ncbi:DUF4856 domain-containing protein [Salegentibacter sp. JZCK2]|uniref:DUF4856 domain-containing protein n=1 Tax=Salegentibacter tibetensis TaxID=2873600 RepID=UPI001CC903A4|nr:DUF4856 domain-containing protein [Salegentibacter tibetensis]MBZ9730137.1 DUF4856 domain-containing protein [Salegentibacter tibetensis]
MKKILTTLAFSGLAFTSCTSDDSVNPDNIKENQVEVPAQYSFERNGESTVAYTGQTQRLQMVKELFSSFQDFDNATQNSLSNMFSNENDPFTRAELNETSKSIKSKVAASRLYFSTNTVASNEIKADFEDFISIQANEVFPNENELASPGKAGQIAAGSSERYIDGKGLEADQAFAKGLIGALVADQILNNYLSVAVLDEGDNLLNNDEGNVEEGKNYTTMEHKWDEAYGYLYGDASIPSEDPNTVLNESDDILLFKYFGSVNNDSDFEGVAEETFEAFKIGRAAIVAGDYDLRDEQVEIIRENISTVIAVRAIYYLQAGKNQLADGQDGVAFHSLSEGYGFIYSLMFTHNPETGAPYISAEKVENYLEQLMAENGFWDVTPETLDAISEDIAAAFDFNVEQAAQ